jgi:hypothetical protein
MVVTQNCPVNPVGPGTILTYSGSVSNAGNITLTNVVVTNDRSGATPLFTAATYCELPPVAGGSSRCHSPLIPRPSPPLFLPPPAAGLKLPIRSL